MKRTVSIVSALAVLLVFAASAFAGSKPFSWVQVFSHGGRTEYYDQNNKATLTPSNTLQATIKVVDSEMLKDPDMKKNNVAYIVELREFDTSKPAFRPIAFFFYDAKDNLLHIEDVKDQSPMSAAFAENTPPFKIWKTVIEKAGYKIQKGK